MSYKKKQKQPKINKEIKSIGDSLPYGAKKEIAELSGITEQTIVKYFKGLKVRPEISMKILTASQVYIDKAIETEMEIERLTKSLSK